MFTSDHSYAHHLHVADARHVPREDVYDQGSAGVWVVAPFLPLAHKRVSALLDC